MKNTITFEAAGATGTQVNDVPNCRIRTGVINDDGQKMYIELMSGKDREQVFLYCASCHYVSPDPAIDDENELGVKVDGVRAEKLACKHSYTMEGIKDFLAEVGVKADDIAIDETRSYSAFDANSKVVVCNPEKMNAIAADKVKPLPIAERGIMDSQGVEKEMLRAANGIKIRPEWKGRYQCMGKRLQKMVDGIAALPPEERHAAIKDKFEKKEWNHADVKWQLQSNKRQYEEKSQGR